MVLDDLLYFRSGKSALHFERFAFGSAGSGRTNMSSTTKGTKNQRVMCRAPSGGSRRTYLLQDITLDGATILPPSLLSAAPGVG